MKKGFDIMKDVTEITFLLIGAVITLCFIIAMFVYADSAEEYLAFLGLMSMMDMLCFICHKSVNKQLQERIEQERIEQEQTQNKNG